MALIGRERELARLRAAMAANVRLLLVSGDAGVGKTRFTSEGMACAAAQGVVAVRGECLPLAGTLPLLPIAAALSELAGIDEGTLLDAALAAAPPYVRDEVARLLPRLGSGDGPAGGGLEEAWQRARLFSALAEFLEAVATTSGSSVGLLVEDVHWADSTTLDCLTFLAYTGRQAPVTVVATCRGDEARVAEHAAEWLARIRADAGVQEIRLGPLPRPEADDLAAALAGGPVPPGVAEKLYARAEGNPFFTEQLVAAALDGARGAALSVPDGLPARLSEVLAARARRCDDAARTVLAALAVAGRPLGEPMLGTITGLAPEAVRGGLRELTESRLLADDTAQETSRPRHALLAEAMAGRLLPGERAGLHERVAAALAAAGDDELAAEVAGHWQAAGLADEELPARFAAAGAAERVCGYAEAAAHYLRAIELCDTLPAANQDDLPGLYLRAIGALNWSGASVRASALAEEAYQRFAGHTDPAVAAAVRHRAAFGRILVTPDTGFDLMQEALRLYAKAPPSAGQAEAWVEFGDGFLRMVQSPLEDIHAAVQRGLEHAEATGASGVIARARVSLAGNAFRLGRIEEGHALLQQCRAEARATQSATLTVLVARSESYALNRLARFDQAAEVALSGLEHVRQAGLEGSGHAAILALHASDALLARGRTGEAAALVDPLTTGPPDLDHWAVHEARAEIDLLRGETNAAIQRRRMLAAIVAASPAFAALGDRAREHAQRAAELAVWAGRPADALAEARRALRRFTNPDRTIFCGRLLAIGMRACADLAERGHARGDGPAVAAARASADGLASWAEEQMGGIPFAEHPFVALIPAERATWDAERTRGAGSSDPDSWSRAARAWQEAGCPHRAGYAWWRHAEAQLDCGRRAPATDALRAAAAAADGHVPLLTQVSALAKRARIPLQPAVPARPLAPARAPYGLTERELAALRLLAAGNTNAQIAAALYISPSTASVHVTSILRKLGVSGRVQAAALAERAGLLDEQA
jgi:DNA-binding CsgD family transcriptional regulator